MKLNSAGIAGVSLVVAAILGGAAGGALVLSGDGSPAEAPRPVEMGIKTADEATVPPTASPSAAPSPSSTDAPAPPKESQPVTVTNPEPSAEEPAPQPQPDEPAPPRQPAAEEPVAEEPVATPKPAPVVTPEPTPVPECPEGETIGYTDNWQQRQPGWTPGEKTCVNGKWVITKTPQPPAE